MTVTFHASHSQWQPCIIVICLLNYKMEPKKVSFGFFGKLLKKPAQTTSQIPEERKQFIDCLEGNSIKVIGGEVAEEKQPLVIPLKNKTSTAASLARIALEVEPDILQSELPPAENEIQAQPTAPHKNESLDEKAMREILEGLDVNTHKDGAKSALVLPVTEFPSLTGEKESTLEDYENIPISEFGLALLRGMGWKQGEGMGKHQKSTNLTLPTLRPKGMGLGADKSSAKMNEKQDGAAKEEEIKLIKGSYVKIVAGKQAGTYGQVTGFDDDSGRIIVKAACGGINHNLNEFMVQTITPQEYNKHSKVINAVKYEEYKLKELKKENIKIEKREPSESIESAAGNSKNSCPMKDTKNRSPSRERERHRQDDKRSANRRNSSISSLSSCEEERRDRDKKRKGKKKKRDRSRSPKDRRRRH